MNYLFLFLNCFVLQEVPKLQADKMGSSMWCTIVRFQSQNLSFVKVCVYVLCVPKKHLRECRCSQWERHAKQFSHTRLKDASWYFSLHASPFVSFNYSLVVNKLLSCWCFISHSDCYDNVFVFIAPFKTFPCFKVNKDRVNQTAVVSLKVSLLMMLNDLTCRKILWCIYQCWHA